MIIRFLAVIVIQPYKLTVISILLWLFLCLNKDTTQPSNCSGWQVAGEQHSTATVLPPLHKLAFCSSPSFGAFLCSEFWLLYAKSSGTTLRPENFSRWKSHLSDIPRGSICTSQKRFYIKGTGTLQTSKWGLHNAKTALMNERARFSCRNLKKLFSKFNTTLVIVFIMKVIKNNTKQDADVQKSIAVAYRIW